MNFRQSRRFTLSAIALLLLSITLFACGGGSSGTGTTGSLDFQGRVRTQGGVGIEGLEVTVAETGASDITDENGEFAIQTSFTGEEVNLFIDQAGIGDSLNLGEIPPDSRVDVDVVVSIEGNRIVITLNSITVTPL